MAIIQFQNGTKVQFNGTPTPQDVEEVAQRIGITQQTQTQPQESGMGGIFGVLKGAAKGVGSTIKGIGDLGARALSAITPKKIREKAGIVSSTEYKSPIKDTTFQPQGTAEKIGFGAEQFGELFIPGGAGLKVGKLVGTATKILPKAVGFLARTATRAGTGAVAFGGARALQTGKIGEEAKQGAIGGAVGEGLIAPVATKTLGFISKNLPERFLSNFFKNTADDMVKKIKTEGLQKLQKQNPELLEVFRKQGIIKIGKNQQIQVDPTLAQEAIAKGFGSGKTGRSLEAMSQYSLFKQMEIENSIRSLVGKSGKITESGAVKTTSKLSPDKFWVKLGNKKKSYIDLLIDLQEKFKEQGYGGSGFLQGEIKNAGLLLNNLKSTTGDSIPADMALRLRRFIDGTRNTTSFRLNAKLTEKQASYKQAADYLRSKLAEIPELKSLMTEYKFYINAADSLVSEAVRRNNARVLTLFDAIVGGTSISANVPGAGLGFFAIARGFQSPTILSFLANKLSGLQKFTPLVEKGATPAIQSIQSLNRENL